MKQIANRKPVLKTGCEQFVRGSYEKMKSRKHWIEYYFDLYTNITKGDRIDALASASFIDPYVFAMCMFCCFGRTVN